jgi:hypothetical protein
MDDCHFSYITKLKAIPVMPLTLGLSLPTSLSWIHTKGIISKDIFYFI